jgi:putative transposase
MIYEKSSIYHLFNRGCDKRSIFLSDKNYYYFLNKIRLSKEKYNVDVIAYCLMPNHFHLLVKQNSISPISKWIQNFLNGYVQAFNRQNNRKGTLFESSTQPRLINKESYLYCLIHYIHYNPVKAKLVDDPLDWKFSSFGIWTLKNENTFIPSQIRNEFFLSTKEYKKSFDDYVNLKEWENDAFD